MSDEQSGEGRGSKSAKLAAALGVSALVALTPVMVMTSGCGGGAVSMYGGPPIEEDMTQGDMGEDASEDMEGDEAPALPPYGVPPIEE